MQRYLTLEKIIELGSFTKAADALGYTQSSVSQMVASLENELSIKLLTRSRTGVRLTLEGAELYPFIEQTLLKYRAMREKAHEITGLKTGIIRVGTFSSVTCNWMPQLIRGFQALYPDVHFLFHQGDYSSVLEWIRTGVVDFGFVTPAAAPGLETVPIKDGDMLAVLPEGHPLLCYDTIPLEKLALEPFILLEEGHYNEPLNAFYAIGKTPNVKYTFNDDHAIMTMVEAGLGVSILSALVLRRMNYRIGCRPVSPPVVRRLSIGYKDKEALPMASKYFIKYLLENADTLC